MLIVGSHSFKYSNSNFYRESADIDIFCYKEDFAKVVKNMQKSGKKVVELGHPSDCQAYAKFHDGTIVDCSFLDISGDLTASNNEIYNYCKSNAGRFAIDSIGVCWVAPIEIVYLMKLSHKYKKDSPHFLKTRKDIRDMAMVETTEGDPVSSLVEYDPELKAMLINREKATYTNALPKLNVTKEEFFTDSVPYKYDHDSIHEAVKHLDKPAYQYYIKDGEQVLCDMEKFKQLPHIVRMYGVLEESYVLALERSIIPFGTDPELAFNTALEKVCTSITSGVFREYAYDNYFEVKAMYHKSFVDKFNKALEAGKILPFKALT